MSLLAFCFLGGLFGARLLSFRRPVRALARGRPFYIPDLQPGEQRPVALGFPVPLLRAVLEDTDLLALQMLRDHRLDLDLVEVRTFHDGLAVTVAAVEESPGRHLRALVL